MDATLTDPLYKDSLNKKKGSLNLKGTLNTAGGGDEEMSSYSVYHKT